MMIRVLLIFLLITYLSTANYSQTITWTGAGDGINWSDANNWDLNTTPGSINDVIIPSGFTSRINATFGVNAVVVQNNAILEWNSTLTVTTSVTVNSGGAIEWNSGTFSNGTLDNNGLIRVLGASSKALINGATINNSNSMVWEGAGVLTLNDGIINNLGLIDLQIGSIIQQTGVGGIINNQGTFRKSVDGNINSSINLPFTNSGTIEVLLGTLSFTNDVSLNSGTYSVLENAFLRFSGSTALDGVIASDIAGQFVLSGVLTISNTVNLDIGGAGLDIEAISITGGGTLVNDNTINFISASSKALIGGTTIENNGTLNWLGSGIFTFNDGTLNNLSGALMDLQVGSTIQQTGTGGIINNEGALLKSTSGSVNSNVNLPFVNTGVVDVETGILSFNSTVTFDQGTYRVAEGAILSSTSSTTFQNTISSDPIGQLVITGTLQIPNTTIINFGGSGLDLGAININGGGLLINENTLNFITSSSKALFGNTTIENRRNMNWLGSGIFTLNDGIIDNTTSGEVNLQVGSTIQQTGTGGTINNAGRFLKSVNGSVISSINLPFVNTGTIEVQTGILDFNSTVTFNQGTYEIAEDAQLRSTSTTILEGSITSDPIGQLVITGTLQIPNTATVDFGGTGLNIGAANINGGGLLINENTLNIITSSSKALFGNTTIENRGNMNWLGSGIFTLNDGTINNTTNAVIDLQVGSVIQQTGSGGTINNEGRFVKSSNGSVISSINLPFINIGTIDVQTGTLSFSSTVVFDQGTYQIEQDAILQSTSTTTLEGTISSELSGQLVLTGTLSVPNTTNLDFGGRGLDLGAINITGGGTLINDNILNIITASSKALIGSTTITNNSVMNWLGSGILTLNSGTINNTADGIIDLQIGSVIQQTGSGGVINNEGRIVKSTDGNVNSAISLPLINTAVLEVQQGILSLSGTVTLRGGTYVVSEGSILSLTGTTTLEQTLLGDPVGQFVLTGTLSVTSDAIVNLGGTGLDLGGININGGGTLTNRGILNMTTASSKSLVGGTAIENDGTINWQGSGIFTFNSGIINNSSQGIIDLQIGSTIQQTGSGGTINNAGIVQKSVDGSVFTFINLPFINTGTTSILTGNLVFNSQFENRNGGRVVGVATLDLPALSSYSNEGTFAPGTSPGELTVIGDFEMEASADLEFELNGLTPGSEHDVLTISGNADLRGGIDVLVGFEPALDDEFIVLTTSGTVRTCELPSTVTSNIFANSRYVFDVLCNTDNVTLRVIEIIQLLPPIADNDTASIDQSGSVLINLIDGDIDPDGILDPTTLTIISQPQNGTVINNGDGTVTYTHNGSQEASDSFTYQVSDADGLVSNIATVSIFIQIEPASVEIEIFNAVSPNGDGNNDFFYIENIQFFENNKLIIFNRWGDRVYDASGYNNDAVAFTGKSNVRGTGMLPAGTYYYQLDLGDGSSTKTGYLQLKY